MKEYISNSPAETENIAAELAKEKELVFVCGHYEGIDQRFIDECVDEEISLGDFVLTGGEIAAMAVKITRTAIKAISVISRRSIFFFNKKASFV